MTTPTDAGRAEDPREVCRREMAKRGLLGRHVDGTARAPLGPARVARLDLVPLGTGDGYVRMVARSR